MAASKKVKRRSLLPYHVGTCEDRCEDGDFRLVDVAVSTCSSFSYAREKASRGPASTVPSVQSLGSMIPFQPAAHAIQQIRVNGFFSFGDNPQASFVRNNFTWSDDVSWVKGKHDVRFGWGS